MDKEKEVLVDILDKIITRLDKITVRLDKLEIQNTTPSVRKKKDTTPDFSNFNETLKWTQEQMSGHTDSLPVSDIKGIIKQAISGKPTIRKQRPLDKRPEGLGAKGSMAKWLNENMPNIITKGDVWASIDDAQEDAKERMAALTASVKGSWDETVNIMTVEQLRDLQKSIDTAQEDMPKTDKEHELVLMNLSEHGSEPVVRSPQASDDWLDAS